LPFIPKFPPGCAHLDLKEVERALVRHRANIDEAAKELGVSRTDLRKLTWHSPKILEEALFWCGVYVSRCRGVMIEALTARADAGASGLRIRFYRAPWRMGMRSPAPSGRRPRGVSWVFILGRLGLSRRRQLSLLASERLRWRAIASGLGRLRLRLLVGGSGSARAFKPIPAGRSPGAGGSGLAGWDTAAQSWGMALGASYEAAVEAAYSCFEVGRNDTGRGRNGRRRPPCSLL
jgi:hypothetical protein